jgi:hypothetical protein
MTMVKVKDLPDLFGAAQPHPMLLCEQCFSQFSANKGDYFMHPKDYVFTCCGENMRLVRKVVRYEDVSLQDA